MAENAVFAGPLESVRVVPGAPWPALAAVVDAAAGERTLGLVRAGALDVADWSGAPFSGEVVVRQLRTGPVQVEAELPELVCGSEPPIPLATVRLEVVLRDPAVWPGLYRLLRETPHPPGTAIGRELEAELERTVRELLRTGGREALRGGAVPGLPVPLGLSLEIRSLHLVERASALGPEATAEEGERDGARAGWSASAEAGTTIPVPEPAPVPCPPPAEQTVAARAAEPAAPAGLSEPEAERSDAPGWDADWDTAWTTARDDDRDLEMDRLYARDEALDRAWRQAELPLTGLRAIGCGRADGHAVVAVLYREREQLPYGPQLQDAFRQIAPGARIDVLEAGPTLGDTLEGWLDDYGLPADVRTSGVRIRAGEGRLLLELGGDGAAAFVEQLYAAHAAGIAALDAVLPWDLAVVADGDEGTAPETADAEGAA